MRRSLVSIQLLLLAVVVLGTVGCRKLLAGLAKDDDAGLDAAAVVAADADASLPATAAAAPSASSAAAAVVAKAAPPKCAKGESLIEFESGSRGCATECTDPSCSCEIGFTVLPNGKVSSAPGDRRSFCPKAKAGAKKRVAVPRCAAGQGLFAEDDTSPIFCSRSCDKDVDCKPAKCNQNLFGADETGTIFVGVGKQVFACDRGFGPPTAASASGGPARPFASASAAASGSARPATRRP